MKVKDVIKKQTTIIAMAVVLVAITVIGVSYAIFFDVKKNANNQVITAGTLKLTVAGANKLTISNPIDGSLGLASTPVSYTVQNSGNIPARYTIYVYADTDNTLDLSKIKVSTDGNSTKGNTAKTLSSISSPLVENGKTYYPISSGTINAGVSDTTKYLRVWIDEDSLNTVVTSKKVNLKMYIVSEVKE